MPRTSFAILSSENLIHNAKVMQKKAAPAKVIAMVKANAYGHGIRSVSLRLEPYVDMFGVASIDEALVLRKVGVKAPILLAEGAFEANELLEASALGFQLVFHNQLQLDWLNKLSLPRPIHAWLKVNTGMNRLGFMPAQAEQVFEQLSNCEQVFNPVRIMSHFACSEDKNHPLNAQQIATFNAFAEGKKALKTLNNSAAVYNFPETNYDFVRPGVALYGYSPFEHKTPDEIGLKPVMTVQSALISVYDIEKGARVGYGARYVAARNMRVGVVAFGYGDGYPTTIAEGAPVIVNHTRCATIGKVAMDMLTVDLTHCPNAQIGDPVILWGEGLPVEDLAEYTRNSAYDILTGVQQRVKFLWTHPLE